MLSDKDIEYITKATNLSLEKAKILTEEPRDLDLVTEQIVKKPLFKKDLAALSFPFFIKLVIFRFANESEFKMEEKSYVAGLVERFIPMLKKREKLIHKKGQPVSPEDIAGFCLVALGFAHDKIDSSNEELVNHAQEHFNKAGKEEMAKGVGKWVEIFQKIRQKKIIIVT